MPKVRLGRSAGSGSSRRRPPPEGWELIEPTLEELEGKMREAETESHEGKRKVIRTDHTFDHDSAKLGGDEGDKLPPYLPSINGCRSVEEFQFLSRVGEGSYGVVYRGRDKKTLEMVALKKLKMGSGPGGEEGFPITTLREINTLLRSQHPNIINVREVVMGSSMDNVYIVMDFVANDLWTLMGQMKEKGQVFLPGEIKCLMGQLLEAIAHLHDNWIIHRDLKTPNLLLNDSGVLKVGDFGMAREYGSHVGHCTPLVVTLWYRAPELLLGQKYSTQIDVWSVGCIFGELIQMSPLFQGETQQSQLCTIFKVLGTPSEKEWPEYHVRICELGVKLKKYPESNLREKFPHEVLSGSGLELLRSLLTCNPNERATCMEALSRKYFSEAPRAINPSGLVKSNATEGLPFVPRN